MKNRIQSLSISFFLVALTSCWEAEPHPYTIVFCDFTTSVDTQSFDKIKNDALTILSRQEAQSRIDFYSISKNPNAPCLYSQFNPADYLKPSEIRAFKETLPQRMDSLKKKLDEASSTASSKRKEPNSCIIDYIERAINDFRNYSEHTTAPLQLIILSDMLECCSGENRPTLCMDSGKDITESLESIKEVTDSTLSFQVFPDIKVCIVLASDYLQRNNKTNFKLFWKQVFARYGFQNIPEYSSQVCQ